MKLDEIMMCLYNNSRGTYYKWKKENRPIILLLEKYFKKDDLEEFLNTNKIKDLDIYLQYKDSEEFKLFKQFSEFQKLETEKKTNE